MFNNLFQNSFTSLGTAYIEIKLIVATLYHPFITDDNITTSTSSNVFTIENLTSFFPTVPGNVVCPPPIPPPPRRGHVEGVSPHRAVTEAALREGLQPSPC